MCGTCQRCGSSGQVRDVMLGVLLGGAYCMVCAVAVRQEKTLWLRTIQRKESVRTRGSWAANSLPPEAEG